MENTASVNVMGFPRKAFPKTKITFEREEISDPNKIQENMMGQLITTGRTVRDPEVPTLKGTEASLSYVQCFLYHLSSSINVYIFHIAWLDTFWTDLIYITKLGMSLIYLLKLPKLILQHNKMQKSRFNNNNPRIKV